MSYNLPLIYIAIGHLNLEQIGPKSNISPFNVLIRDRINSLFSWDN